MLKYAHFLVENQAFILMDSGVEMPFSFNEAVSFVVNCTTQKEVDYYWNALISGGGSESRCGWLKDKFGVSWQIIPKALMDLMGDKDPVKAQYAMQAMLKMTKIVIKDLKNA
jgi:predicted 3-demethylubiquinone-9 3-methyltransferase (glyoxalase superfamily)